MKVITRKMRADCKGPCEIPQEPRASGSRPVIPLGLQE
jgi:hypothetical protein